MRRILRIKEVVEERWKYSAGYMTGLNISENCIKVPNVQVSDKVPCMK